MFPVDSINYILEKRSLWTINIRFWQNVSSSWWEFFSYSYSLRLQKIRWNCNFLLNKNSLIINNKDLFENISLVLKRIVQANLQNELLSQSIKHLYNKKIPEDLCDLNKKVHFWNYKTATLKTCLILITIQWLYPEYDFPFDD